MPPVPERALRWSNSALTTLQQCGEKFRRRYIARERVPPSARQVRGTVVHIVARETFKRKLAQLAPVGGEEARDVAATEFDAKWREGVILAPDEEADGLVKVRAQAKDFAVDVSGYHAERVAPTIEPRFVEHDILVKPKDSDIEIRGTLDLVSVESEGLEFIRDLKTSEKAPNRNAADTSQQLTMYAMIRLAETTAAGAPKLPDAVVLDTLVRTPVLNQKSHVKLISERSHEDVGALVERINTAVAGVKAGIFYPANPDSWWCSAQWCEFYGSCKYVKRGERRPTS